MGVKEVPVIRAESHCGNGTPGLLVSHSIELILVAILRVKVS